MMFKRARAVTWLTDVTPMCRTWSSDMEDRTRS